MAQHRVMLLVVVVALALVQAALAQVAAVDAAVELVATVVEKLVSKECAQTLIVDRDILEPVCLKKAISRYARPPAHACTHSLTCAAPRHAGALDWGLWLAARW